MIAVSASAYYSRQIATALYSWTCSQHPEPALKAASKMSRAAAEKPDFLVNLLFVSPVEDGASFSTVLLWTWQTQRRRRKSIFWWASGNESAWLDAFLAASHSASHFLTLRCEFLLGGSLEFSSRCALTLMPPFKHISLFVSPSFLPSLPPRDLCQVQPCDPKQMWQCPATTRSHPCHLMTLPGSLPCRSPPLPGWVPAESALKSCTLAVLPVHSAVDVTLLWQMLLPTRCHYHRSSHWMLWGNRTTGNLGDKLITCIVVKNRWERHDLGRDKTKKWCSFTALILPWGKSNKNSTL